MIRRLHEQPADHCHCQRPGVGVRPEGRSGRLRWAVLGVIALGGGLGGLARYVLGVWAPTPPGAFPWTTFAVNVSGCALIGVLMLLATDLLHHRPLLRPFLGVGFLGGYTTFSFHVLEARQLFLHPAGVTAVLYLAGTAVAAIAAVTAGVAATRWLIRWRLRGRGSA